VHAERVHQVHGPVDRHGVSLAGQMNRCGVFGPWMHLLHIEAQHIRHREAPLRGPPASARPKLHCRRVVLQRCASLCILSLGA
jgi:hypothetical protein